MEGSGNFDIGKKRLANVAKPEETFDAMTKDYFDKRYGFLHDMYDRFRISFNSYLTKLDEKNKVYFTPPENTRELRERILNEENSNHV